MRRLLGLTVLGVLLISGWSTFQLSADVGTIKLDCQTGDAIAYFLLNRE